MDTTPHLASLATFRASAYAAFGRRRDALFEWCDTLLTTGSVPSLPVLSIQAQHQRRWGSRYDALAVGQIRGPALEQLLDSHPLAGGERIDAVDVSVWPRCDAPDQRGACALLSRLAPFGWPPHRRRLGLFLGRFLDRAGRLRPRELDGAPARAAAAPPS